MKSTVYVVRIGVYAILLFAIVFILYPITDPPRLLQLTGAALAFAAIFELRRSCTLERNIVGILMLALGISVAPAGMDPLFVAGFALIVVSFAARVLGTEMQRLPLAERPYRRIASTWLALASGVTVANLGPYLASWREAWFGATILVASGVYALALYLARRPGGYA